MSQHSSLLIDANQPLQLEKAVPNPRLTSHALPWKHLQFGYFEIPPKESPECAFLQHAIAVNVGPTVRSERIVDHKIDSELIQTGEMVYVNPAGMSRVMRSKQSIQVVHLYLEPTYVQHMAKDLTDPDQIELTPQFKTYDPLIHNLSLKLKEIASARDPMDYLYVESATMMLSAHLLRFYSNRTIITNDYPNGLCPTQVRQVVEYINAHLSEVLLVDDLAQLVSLSPFYFARMFKKVMGVTPHRYIINQRLNRAKYLLQHTNFSVTTIAQEVGFADQSRFCTVFRQQVQLSPTTYRSQFR